MNNEKFIKAYLNIINFKNNLILEDYKTFPVPKNLLDDAEKFINDNLHNDFAEKIYNVDELKSLLKNWKYFDVFQEKLDLILKNEKQCNLYLATYSTEEGFEKAYERYEPQLVPGGFYEDHGIFLELYKNKFPGLNYLIIINLHNMQEHEARSLVEHEMIHWVQSILNYIDGDEYSSNYESKYGKFSNEGIEEYLTDEQMDYLDELDCPEDACSYIEEYFFSEDEFEAWCSSVSNSLKHYNWTPEEYKRIIENNKLFKKIFNSSDEIKQRILLFGKGCQFISKNNPNDDRWWYLLEALKENN